MSTVQDLAKAIIDHLGTDPSKYEQGWIKIRAIAAEETRATAFDEKMWQDWAPILAETIRAFLKDQHPIALERLRDNLRIYDEQALAVAGE